MLPFNEIKNDMKNGYGYMEYEGTWKGYNYTIVLEKSDSIIFRFTDNEYEAVFKLKKDTFMELNYKEYIKFIHNCLYYNLLPVEEE